MLRILSIVLLLLLQAQYAVGVYVHNCVRIQQSKTFIGNFGCHQKTANGEAAGTCCKKATQQPKKGCKVEFKFTDTETQTVNYTLKQPILADTDFYLPLYIATKATWLLTYKQQEAITFYDTSPPLIYTTERYKFIRKFTI